MEQLALVRYEELLEMGLSKVQCHLVFAKVSTAGADGELVEATEAAGLAEGTLRVVDVRDAAMAEELAGRAAMGPLDSMGGALPSNFYGSRRQSPAQARRAHSALQRPRATSYRLMPPPLSSPAPEAPSTTYRSHKRPRSSHLSTAAARGGSSHISTADGLAESRGAESQGGSSSSSRRPPDTLRARKRRRQTSCHAAPQADGLLDGPPW